MTWISVTASDARVRVTLLNGSTKKRVSLTSECLRMPLAITLPTRTAALLCTLDPYCVWFYRNRCSRFVRACPLSSVLCLKARSEHEYDVVLLLTVPPSNHYALLSTGNLFCCVQETVPQNKTWLRAHGNSSTNYNWSLSDTQAVMSGL